MKQHAFRFWDEEKKEMLYSGFMIDPLGTAFKGKKVLRGKLLLISDVIDRKGTYIAQGDLITDDRGYYDEIIYEHGALKHKDIGAGGIGIMAQNLIPMNASEIVGNIYGQKGKMIMDKLMKGGE